MSRPPFRCAGSARDRADPPLGTAPRTLRWLLLEHDGPWRSDALAGSGLPEDLLGRLNGAAVRADGRILLIRRPGRQRRSRRRRWAVADAVAGTVWGDWSRPDDLEEAAEVLGGEPWTGGQADPVLLVCTHGVHDTCCALRGRPVAAVLHEQWPDATWECSHVGGDRFAANVVVLPDGVYYGNLDAGDASGVFAEHLEGRMDIAHLRGLARFTPVVQVAVGALLERYGPFPAAAVTDADAYATAADRWVVEVGVSGQPRRRVTVATSPRPAAALTCHAARRTSAVGYEVVEVATLI